MTIRKSKANRPSPAAAQDTADDPEELLGALSADPVCRAIYSAIQEGELKPGVKLGEDQLAAVFKVNRTRIREALRQLASAGLVTIFRNRGAFVAEPTREVAEETYAARILIEAEIVASIARKHSRSDIAALRRHIARQKAAFEAGNRRDYVRLLGEFHLLLAKLAGNRTLGQFLARLVAQTVLIVILYDRGGPPDCSLTEHEEMLSAIVEGDVETSQRLMRAHLQETLDRLDLDRHEEEADLASIFEPILARSRA